MAKRNSWSFGPYRSSLGSLSIFFLGRASLTWSGSTEVCLDGVGLEMWWYIRRKSTKTIQHKRFDLLKLKKLLG